MNEDVGRIGTADRAAGLRPQPATQSSQSSIPCAEFVAKRFEVRVSGYGAGIYIARTRGRALADAWRSDAFSHLTFGEFLKVARCYRTAAPPTFGDPILVGGRRAFFIGSNSQYVQLVWPGSDVVLNSHPYDVEPCHYRPSAYRDSDGSPKGRDAQRLDCGAATARAVGIAQKDQQHD